MGEILRQRTAEVLRDDGVVEDVNAAVRIHIHADGAGSVTGEQRSVVEDVNYIVTRS